MKERLIREDTPVSLSIMRSGKAGRLAPGHQKILQELAARGAMTKEEIAALIGNRNLAVKYRRDLQEWGLIRLAPRKVEGKTIDAYVLTPKGLETYYACQLFSFFEKALFSEEQTKPVLMVDPNGTVIIRENDLHTVEGLRLLYIFYGWQLPIAVARIRTLLDEFWDDLVLTQFDKEEREALTNYRAKLKEMHRLYLEIWLRRVLKENFGVKGRSLDEVLAEVARILLTGEGRIRSALLKYYAHDSLDKVVKTTVGELDERDFKFVKAAYEAFIQHLMWQYDVMIINTELLMHFLNDIIRDGEVAAEAAEEERARLQALYNELTDSKMIQLYQRFLDKRARQPKELIIIPSGGFRGYFAKYWEYVNALGDEEEKRKVMRIFREARETSLWPPFMLYGMLPEPPLFKHGEENEE
jgi:hypothetical protein